MRWQFWLGWFLKLALVGFVAFAIVAVYLDGRVRNKLGDRLWQAPAQVYARTLHLYPEMPLSPDDFQRELDLLGYRRGTTLQQPGDEVRQGNTFKIYRRAFSFEDGAANAQQLQVMISDQRIVALRDEKEKALDLAKLEPLSLGSMFTTSEDRVLVQLDGTPPLLTKTLMLVEDRDFYHHFGLSPRGVLRAMFANIRAGRNVQGGSTLTQQLVKNVFLSNERSYWRKVKEAVMSLLVEYHYSKGTILEAYLNEIYLGQEGPRPIHGFALASRHYFNRPIEELRSDQIAMLVGLVKGPSQYDPWRSPERAQARRDLVLKLMNEEGLIDAKEYGSAIKRDLGLAKASAADSLHPAYLDLVRRQLRRDYQERDLKIRGLRIFTAFDPLVQWHAERSLSRALTQLDPKEKGLEGAMVVTDIVSGEVVAMVGGRQMHYAGFNRALDAVRPMGSLVKPAVYLTALESKRYTLISKLDDTAVDIKVPGGRWQPKNYDKQFHGEVPLYFALAESYNAATAHLGMDLTVPKVLATIQRLGVERDMPVVPAVFLGAGELSPLEVAVMYQTIAAQGVSAGLRSIRTLTDSEGTPLARYPQKPMQAVSPAAIHVLQYAMQDVMQEGTGRAAKNVLPNFRVAGKTGTTDDLRDSWFAGFSGDYLSVVWMGRDDNKSTGLSGATGALKGWLGFMAETSHVPMSFDAPPGINYVWVDELTGLVSGEGCEHARYIPFIEGTEPTTVDGTCQPGGAVLQWFHKLF
ncbi:MAG: penicillin-binding protein [Verrucomicrobiaceae bacterium]|nr:penicillin-binding protein [Verrucomicrobiaceae bacterium]